MLSILCEPFLFDWQTSVPDLHVSNLGDVIHHCLIFFDRYRTSRVDDNATRLATVYSCSQQFPLQVRILSDINHESVRLDTWITGDDAKPGARGVQKNSIEPFDVLRQLATIVVDHCAVSHSETLQVEVKWLKIRLSIKVSYSESLLLGIICDKNSLVLHHLGDVGGFSSWSCSHV